MKWETLEKLAEKKGITDGENTSFAGRFPGMWGGDFDALKNEFCQLRPHRLRSADALFIGKDGYIYFIEFKDTKYHPLKRLREKAFDSLIVFWLMSGNHLSLADICRRSVFVYVSPDGCFDKDTVDAEDAFLDITVVGPPPLDEFGMPIKARLADLLGKKLYAKVWTISADEFALRFQKMLGRATTIERLASLFHLKASFEKWRFHARLKHIRHTVESPVRAFSPFPGTDASLVPAMSGFPPTGTSDFRKMAAHLEELRCPLSFRTGRSDGKGLLHADAYSESPPALFVRHDWSQEPYPWARLCDTVFDGFWQWMAVFHSGKTANKLMGTLQMTVGYTHCPPSLPKLDGYPPSVRDFWMHYKKALETTPADPDGCPIKFGLHEYISARFYKNVKTIPMEKISDSDDNGANTMMATEVQQEIKECCVQGERCTAVGAEES